MAQPGKLSSPGRSDTHRRILVLHRCHFGVLIACSFDIMYINNLLVLLVPYYDTGEFQADQYLRPSLGNVNPA